MHKTNLEFIEALTYLETKRANENHINTIESIKIEDKDDHTQLPKERKKSDFLEVKTSRTNTLEITSREKVDSISTSASSSRIVIINESNEPNLTEDNKSSSEVSSNINLKLEESYH